MFQGLIRDEKLRDVSVSYFSVLRIILVLSTIFGERLMSKVTNTTTKLSEKSSCIFGTLHRKHFESFVGDVCVILLAHHVLKLPEIYI